MTTKLRLTAGKSRRLRFSVNSALVDGDVLVFEVPYGALSTDRIYKTSANASEIEIVETTQTSTRGYIYIRKADIPNINRDTHWDLELRTAEDDEFVIGSGQVEIRMGVGS